VDAAIAAIIAVHVTTKNDSDPRPDPIAIPVIRRTENTHAAPTSKNTAVMVVVVAVPSLITGYDAGDDRDTVLLELGPECRYAGKPRTPAPARRNLASEGR
jgi:hypothetical protein